VVSVARDPRPLAERWRPHRLDEFVGNARARYELRTWASRWAAGSPPALRAAVLSGPPGVGKTSAALALAEELGWTVVEMNASDARNESALDAVAGRASITHTLSATHDPRRPARALILLDEADCLTGRLTETPRATPEPAPLPDFLRGRYGAIAALNDAWGLGRAPRTTPFGSWADVPRTPGRSAWAKLPAAARDLDEWRSVGAKHDVSDRGGLAAIARLVRATRQPVVLTVNDDRSLIRYSPVFRSGVARIRFYPIGPSEIAQRLTAVARGERIALADGAIDAIVRRAQGDLRAAMNDLEAVAAVPAGPLQLSLLGTRDVTVDLGLVAAELLSSARYYRATEIRGRIDATPDDLLPWVEENIPRFAPDAVHREAAFRTLAAAELLLARARRWRVYGLWSYASELLTGGVSLTVRDAPVPIGSNASFPQFLGEMGRSRSARAVRDSLSAKVGARLHASRRKSREAFVPMLEGVFLAARGAHAGPALRRTARLLVRELELTPEELGYLLAIDPGSTDVAEWFTDDPESASGPAPGAKAKGSSEPRRVQRSLAEFGAR